MGFGFSDHGVQSNLLFEIIIADECEAIGICLPAQSLFLNRAGMGRIGKELRNRTLKVTLYAFSLDADFAHGLKIAVLLIIAAGIIGQFEKRVINGIECALQQISEPGNNCVADAGDLHRNRLAASRFPVLTEVMYAGLLIHGRLLFTAQPGT